MKNKNVIKIVALLCLFCELSSCGNTTPRTSLESTNSEVGESIISSDSSEIISETTSDSERESISETTSETESTIDTSAELDEYKKSSLNAFNNLFDDVDGLINDNDLLNELIEFYNTSKAKIESIVDIELGREIVEEVLAETREFILYISNKEIEIVKDATLNILKDLKERYIDPLSNEEIKEILLTFYYSLVGKVNEDVTLENLVSKMESITSGAENGITGRINDFIEEKKDELRDYLDEKVKSLLEYVNDDEIKKEINDFYNNGMDTVFNIKSVDDLDSVKVSLEASTIEFINGMSSIILSIGKEKLIDELNAIKNPIYQKIVDEELIDSLDNFLTIQINKIENIGSIEDLKELGKSIVDDFKTFVKTIVETQLNKYKNEALTILDTKLDELLENKYVSEVLNELKINDLVKDFKDDEIEKIKAVESLDDAKKLKDEIVTDCKNFAQEVFNTILANAKAKAKEELRILKDEAMDLIPSDRITSELNPFLEEQIGKIDDINSLDDIDDVVKSIIDDTKSFIKELVIKETKYIMQTYMSNLVNAQNKTPYAYIPEKMIPNNKTVSNPTSLNYDFSNFVSVKDIDYSGYGQQWNMVIDNIAQLQTFASIFNVAQAAITDTTILINEYLIDSDESTEKTFETTKLVAHIKLNEDNSFNYDISFKESFEIKLFGLVKPEIKMTYKPESKENTIVIKLSSTNQIKYVVSDTKFICGLTYGVDDVNRTSYLSIEKGKTQTIGHVFEHIQLKGQDVVPSAADFYIDDTYVSVVGNKADGILVMEGYINELYSTSSGKLLGYKIEESKSIGSFHTLWFNLNDISGIDSIKIGEKTKNNKSSLSENDVYLNGSSTLFSPTYNKIPPTRRYDIEFRSRYYYSYDNDNKLVEYKISLPMMFIQEDGGINANYSNFKSDMLKDNGLNCSVIINSDYLQKIRDDHNSLIDDFKTNKSTMTSNAILTFISE